jgi:DNA polymerase III sliding clamp (beta) subunit (PCNA family)
VIDKTKYGASERVTGRLRMAEKPTLIATVHAALLHEALTRAARIAPTKGEGHDKAGGICIDFVPLEAHIRATNLEMTFFQKVPAEVKEACRVRFGLVIQQFVASLPMDKDQEVRFLRSGKMIVVQFRKTGTKATVPQIEGEFPKIDWYDPDEMVEAHDLGNKIASVAWAAEADATPPINGIHINGKTLEALSSKQCAQIACEIPVDEAVTAVIKDLVPLIKMGTDLRMMARNGKIMLALDEATQVTATTVLGAWPNLTDKMKAIQFTDSFVIPKKRLVEGLDRMLGFVRNDRTPRIFFTINEASVDMSLIGSIQGQIQDSCRLSDRQGPDIEKPVEFVFQPVWLKEAIETFPGATVKAHFADPRKPIRLEEPSTSYEAFVIGMDRVRATAE